MEHSIVTRDFLFDREDTKAIKGIAVVLMMFHHLAGFPERAPVGFLGFSSVFETFVSGGFLQSFALGAQFCASFYFFLGGYGLYLRQKSSNFSVTATILNLYKAYWRVFFVFVPIALLFFARSGEGINELCTYYVFDRKTDMITAVLSNFIGWSDSLNREWWFLKDYICVIPLGYLFSKAIKRNRDVWVDIFLVLGVDVLFRSICRDITALFPTLNTHFYFTNFFHVRSLAISFFAGIVFAKYNLISVMKQKIHDLLPAVVLKVAAVGVLYWCRTFIIDSRADIIFCGLMIPLLSDLLDACGILKKGFAFLGKHSTNMWLIHSFYCYYFLEITRIVYCSGNVWVDLAVLILLSLVSSILLNGFYKILGQWAGKRRA